MPLIIAAMVPLVSESWGNLLDQNTLALAGCKAKNSQPVYRLTASVPNQKMATCLTAQEAQQAKAREGTCSLYKEAVQTGAKQAIINAEELKATEWVGGLPARAAGPKKPAHGRPMADGERLQGCFASGMIRSQHCLRGRYGVCPAEAQQGGGGICTPLTRSVGGCMVTCSCARTACL